MILRPSLTFSIVGASLTFILLLCLASCAKTQSANVIPLNQIEPDYACGPRCLWAFIHITGVGDPNCDVNCIYELIGKKPYSVTSLKDLKDAAQKLGFSATGYKFENSDLEEMSGYAILPIGSASGATNDPFHFVLVKQASKNYVKIINNRTLEQQTFTVYEMQKSWKGYALVLSINGARSAEVRI